MNLEIKMTERDKKLIVLLMVIVVAAIFGFFVIYPLTKSISDEMLEREYQQNLQRENEEKQVMLPATLSMNEALYKDLEAATADFYSYMQSLQIDKLLTGLVLSKGLESKSLSITMPTEYLSLAPFYASDAAKTTPEVTSQTTEASDTSLDSYLEEDPDTEAVSSDPNLFAGLYSAAVSMTVSGDQTLLQSLVDDLFMNYPSIRITSLSWSTKTGTYQGEGNTYEILTENTLDLRLDVYMYDSRE